MAKVLVDKDDLNKILDYLERRGFSPTFPRDQAVAALESAILPKKSGTFRKGKPGNWQEHFSEQNKALFKEMAGDLLIRLGYETSQDLSLIHISEPTRPY